MNVEAGRLLAENLQDQSVRSGLALAGWNPKHGDMAAQAVEWWKWGKYLVMAATQVSRRSDHPKTKTSKLPLHRSSLP